MKIANLLLVGACFAAIGCSASNTVASNSSTPQTANANANASGSNAVGAAQAHGAPANTAQANTPPARKASPDVVVKDLYKQHDTKNSPFFQTKDRAALDKFFTKKLSTLIWQDAVNSEGEVGALGADPLYDAQDTEITDLKIQADQVDGDQSLVLVTFKNFGKEKTLVFNVEREAGEWKISNITGDDYNLLNMLEEAAKVK